MSARLMALCRSLPARLPRGGWFVVAFFALLALPSLLPLMRPAPVSLGAENRRPAPVPAWPRAMVEVPRLPGAVDAYLADRFGFRDPLIRLNTFLRWHVLGETGTPLLVAGRNGRVFLASHNEAPANSMITLVCGATATDAVIARGVETIRQAIGAVRNAGMDPTLLLVPTAARLHPADLPPGLAAACAGHTPFGDAIAVRSAGLPVIYPVTEMARLGGIPLHRFHWAGAAPLGVEERVAETDWGLARTFPLPVERKTRGSDLNPLSPGLGLSDVIDEPQLRAAGAGECWLAACAGHGPPPEVAGALNGYWRSGQGQLLIIADSFGLDIAPDFLQSFAEVWLVHTNVTKSMSPVARAALSTWLHQRFGHDRVLLVLHDYGAAFDFGRLVADVLTPASCLAECAP